MLSLGRYLGQAKWTVPSTASPLLSSRSLATASNTRHVKNGISRGVLGSSTSQSEHWATLGFGQRFGNLSIRNYARPKMGAGPITTKIKNTSPVPKSAKKREVEAEEPIRDEEGDLFPDLEAPLENESVPEVMEKPMKEIKLPKQRHVFNYKTYRYKDLSAHDPSRIVASFTVPASRGTQVRPGEAHTPIIHSPEDLGEDLSKDAILSQPPVPLGLDAPVVPYTKQLMKAIYDILVQEKGEDIVVIDIENKTNWVPTMIIVTALSPRHCVALASKLASELKRTKLCKSVRTERNVGDEWVIVATGVVIVEIMTQESRDYMDLERLWVLKKSAQETFEFDEEEERFMYDEEDGMWDDDDPNSY